ncbi:MAG: DUF4062 domain-containing protein [Planctomycetes bacterium]|nr:DUF4062 domain-containing protein [Planctomycetota bacterium]
MGPAGRQFRVFVSSTFSDFKCEREALQERVFPRLRASCERRGARFQAIDLRWGISAEAARESKTVRICLEEIRRSQRLSPRPNFIVLLGSRYGWRPTPEEIPEAEFQSLLAGLDASERALVVASYRRDANAVPPVYYLHENRQDADRSRLDSILRKAAMVLPEAAQLKFFASATHLEVHEGLLKTADAEGHVFAYFRNIDGLPHAAEGGAEDFIDLRDGRADAEAADRLEALKAEVRGRLGGHVREYAAQWREPDISLDHIDAFCADVAADLISVIDGQLDQIETIDLLEYAAEQHAAFGEERARVFVGREGPLVRIGNYIESGSAAPLFVHGPGGAGKSALLAAAAARTDRSAHVVIQRFVGATADCGTLRSLLEGLCAEIGRRYGADEGVDVDGPDGLVGLFRGRLALAQQHRRLVLFIDALDQLDVGGAVDPLEWLPDPLPENVRIIASTREARADGSVNTFHASASRRSPEGLVRLEALSAEEGRRALDALLGAGRTLTAAQRETVLSAFGANGLPLYLKLVAEQARLWRSDTAPPELVPEIPALLRAVFRRLQDPANHGPVFVERALAYLQAGRYNGLAEDELAAALAADEEVISEFEERSAQRWDRPGLPPILWSRLYGDLAPYLSTWTIDGTLLYRFYHREFSEVIERDYLSATDAARRHQTLASVFAWQSDPAALRRAGEPRALRQMMELPHQLRCAERGGDPAAGIELLTDVHFILMKCAANRGGDLVDDYVQTGAAASGGNAAFDGWSGFVLSRAHLLRRGSPQWPAHKILTQLAVEYADESPVTAAVEAWLGAGLCDWQWWKSPARPARPRPNPCLAVLEGHKKGIEGALRLADGRILSWSADGIMRFWDPEGVPLSQWRAHGDGIRGVRLLASGRLLSWSSDRTVRLWDASGAELHTLAGHGDSVEGATVLRNGNILSWSMDKTLRLWSADGRELARLEGQPSGVRGAIELRDGRLASWSAGEALLWTGTGEPQGRLADGPDPVTGMRELADGRILIWSQEAPDLPPGAVFLSVHDPGGGPSIALDGHTSSVHGATELRDGRILSWSADFTLRLWSASGEALAVLSGHADAVGGARQLSDGRIVSWSDDGTVRLWREDGAELRSLRYHRSYVWGVLELGDGRIVSWATDHDIAVWDRDGRLRRTLTGHANIVCGVLELPDGRLLSWGDDATLRIWSPAVDSELRSPLTGAEQLSDGRILSWHSDNGARIWDPQGRTARTLEGHAGRVLGATELSDHRLLTWAHDNTLRIWSPAGEAVAVLDPADGLPPLPRRAMTKIGAAGRTKVKLLEDAGVQRRESDLGRVTGTCELQNGCIVSSHWDGLLRIWSPDGELTKTLEHPPGPVGDLKAIGEGFFAARSPDGVLKVWNASGEPAATIRARFPISAWVLLSTGLILTHGSTGPRRQRMLTGYPGSRPDYRQFSLHLWNRTGRLIKELSGHRGMISHVRELADGRILTSSVDGTQRLWTAAGEAIATMDCQARSQLRYTGDDQVVVDSFNTMELSDGRIVIWPDFSEPILRLWSRDGQLLQSLTGHRYSGPRNEQVAKVVHLDCGCIVSWGADGALRLWTADGGEAGVFEEAGDASTLTALTQGRLLALSRTGVLHYMACTCDARGGGREPAPWRPLATAMSYEPYREPVFRLNGGGVAVFRHSGALCPLQAMDGLAPAPVPAAAADRRPGRPERESPPSQAESPIETRPSEGKDALPMSELITEQNCSASLLNQVYDAAYMIPRDEGDGRLVVDDGGTICNVLVTDPPDMVRLVVALGVNPQADEARKLRFVNAVNLDTVVVRATLIRSEMIYLDWYVPVKGGISDRGLVYATKAFVRLVRTVMQREEAKGVIS